MKSNLISLDSPLKETWDIIIAALTIFMSIDVPLHLAYDYQLSNIFLEVIITILLFIDIILNFRTQIYYKGILVRNKKTIKERYIRRLFVFDLLAAVPFYLISIIIPGVVILRLLSLTRLFKLFQLNSLITKWRNRYAVNPSILRLCVFFFWILLISHWIACIWIYIARIELLDKIPTYIDAIYWCITTLTTVGYGDISPVTDLQKILTMIAMIFGVIIYGYVIGNVASLLSNIDKAKAGFLKQMEDINAYLSYKAVPKRLRQKVHSYYHYVWDNQMGQHEHQILSNLPPSLKIEVLMHINKRLIIKVPFFKDVGKEFIYDIISQLQPVVFLPDDIIFKKGDIGNCMYFISTGSADVLSGDSDKVVAKLKDGDYFGEIALIKEVRRTKTVIARDYCNLYSLEKKHFDALLDKYPKFKKHIIETIKSREK